MESKEVKVQKGFKDKPCPCLQHAAERCEAQSLTTYTQESPCVWKAWKLLFPGDT